MAVMTTGGVPGGGDDDAPVGPPIEIESDDAAWVGQVDWAVGRFEAAGLELPDLVVEVHDDDRPCHGNTGLYEPGEVPHVHLCADSPVGSRVARLITLHELGHAWAEALDADAKDALLELRGLDTWNDRDIEPYLWGTEHAAEIVSWGLMDEEIRIIRIPDTEPNALAAGFALLAGQSPLWESPIAN